MRNYAKLKKVVLRSSLRSSHSLRSSPPPTASGKVSLNTLATCSSVRLEILALFFVWIACTKSVFIFRGRCKAQWCKKAPPFFAPFYLFVAFFVPKRHKKSNPSATKGQREKLPFCVTAPLIVAENYRFDADRSAPRYLKNRRPSRRGSCSRFFGLAISSDLIQVFFTWELLQAHGRRRFFKYLLATLQKFTQKKMRCS